MFMYINKKIRIITVNSLLRSTAEYAFPLSIWIDPSKPEFLNHFLVMDPLKRAHGAFQKYLKNTVPIYSQRMLGIHYTLFWEVHGPQIKKPCSKRWQPCAIIKESVSVNTVLCKTQVANGCRTGRLHVWTYYQKQT